MNVTTAVPENGQVSAIETLGNTWTGAGKRGPEPRKLCSSMIENCPHCPRDCLEAPLNSPQVPFSGHASLGHPPHHLCPSLTWNGILP